MAIDVKKTALRAAESSLVLLKNEDRVLPLSKGGVYAFFGRTLLQSIIGGNGSGAARTQNPKTLLEEFEKAGLKDVPALRAFYEVKREETKDENTDMFNFEDLKKAVNSGLAYELFGQYTPPAKEFEVPEDLIRDAASETDTAVLVIGRNSGGEECDRHLQDDYYLTAVEKTLAEKVCSTFKKVVLIINTNGLIDLSWTKDQASLKGILFIGIPGEEGPTACAEVLAGDVTPSGKLAVTIAKQYEDYPVWDDFSWDKDHPENIKTYESYGLDAEANGGAGFVYNPVTLYKEGIYNGYRYFDTGKIAPLYPFGFGLSYTEFEIGGLAVQKDNGCFTISGTIRNKGTAAGREVLQVYVSAEGTALDHPYQELKGFAKTQELKPGEEETLTISVPFPELACYREADASWVIEKGRYLLRCGNASDNTVPAGAVNVPEDIIVFRTENRLGLQECNRGKIDFLTAEPVPLSYAAGKIYELRAEDVEACEKHQVPAEDVSRLSDKEVASLLVGFGAGLPFAFLSESENPPAITYDDGTLITSNSHPTGYNGYVSPAMEKYGISSVFYKDGPAGMGETAWPTEMILACSFDRDILYAMGDAVGQECEAAQINVWLAPALNLLRHPLGGRNFEYYSEDPFLAGSLGIAVTKGVQENHKVLTCAKHFAVNEQETYRRGKQRIVDGKFAYNAVDSIAAERTIRELYLKPFEMVVREAGLHSIMSSFNRINGTFAGGSRDLNTHILREEWGFDGCVVTDWGDMDIVVDGADAVAAGNDVVMPGGPPVIAQILKGYKEGRVTRKEMEEAAGHLLRMVKLALQ